jgi:hypothetical protein
LSKTTENLNVGSTYSKFTRISLIVVSMLLIFAGPTYVPYAMEKVNVNGFVTTGVGAVLFVVGIALMLFLIKKKVITA